MKIKKTAYIANKIIELRKSVEWSQAELSRQIGVTSPAICQIEKGRTMPSLIVIRKLAEVFNVSISELTGDSVSPSQEKNDEAQNFFIRFGEIKKLSYSDQRMIQFIVKRLNRR